MHNGNSIVELVKDLSRQSKAFLREEVQLVKTEISENVSKLGKDALGIAIGGCIGYGGFLIFLGALGVLLGFLFMRLGIEPFLAEFIGLGIIGLIGLGIGGALMFGAIKAMSKQSVAPRRTIETLQHLKGAEPVKIEVAEPEDHRTSEEIKASALAMEAKMAETIEELGERVTLKHAREQADAEIHAHPYKWGLVAMGTGFAGSYLLKRKLRAKAA